ncbi:MAG: RHS domain-containing protein [Desulfuromonadales bacterium]|nr:RHS domain-containing protein [Desulfuromonadales bacterium]
MAKRTASAGTAGGTSQQVIHAVATLVTFRSGCISATRIHPQRTRAYGYDQNGNIKTITYPDNRIVTYTYSDNKPTDITSTYNSSTTKIATGITYQPFGGIETLTYGNGITRSISHDTQYRITGIIDGTTLSYGFTPDANGNFTAISNNLNSAKNKSYTYDALNRLSTATGPWGSLSWTYDGTGNRLTEGTYTYGYQTGTNKLASVSGPTATSFTYDNNGNTTNDNSKTFTYNQNQRLTRATATQTGDYLYNASGQRAKKTVNGVNTYFIYDQSGQLIYETATSGTTANYIYLNTQPIAKTEGNTVYFIHTDHLGTPQAMTDASKAKVWEIETRPFGDSATITGTVTLNLRFPGQYYDAETGLNNNYYRDYNSAIGKYVEADPVGLEGGLSLFAYVRNNPVNMIDPMGLTDAVPMPWWWGAAGEAAKDAGAGSAACGAMVTASIIVIGTATSTSTCADYPPKDECKKKKKCDPCSPYPVGTLGYKGPEVHKRGIDAGTSHYHLYIVEQIPSNCKCIWKEKTKSTSGSHHYDEQPNLFFGVNLNGSGSPPNYPQ